MSQFTHSRILLALATAAASVLLVGCSQAGTPSAASTSGTVPAASSASSPVAPSSTTGVRTPSSTTAGTTGTPATTVIPPTTPPTFAPSGAPDTTGTDLAGEVYGRIVDVDHAASTITLDKYDWFTGPAAEQACAEDGVTEHDNGWCTQYYFRNRNPMLRVLPVSSDAGISTLTDGSPAEAPGDLGTVQQRLSSGDSTGVFRIVVTDGQVTSMNELYFP